MATGLCFVVLVYAVRDRRIITGCANAQPMLLSRLGWSSRCRGRLTVACFTDLPGWSERRALWHKMTGSTPSLERSHTGPPIARTPIGPPWSTRNQVIEAELAKSLNTPRGNRGTLRVSGFQLK
jgi:hypothetical protein